MGENGTAVIRLTESQVFENVLQNARAMSMDILSGCLGRGEGTYFADTEAEVANYNWENPLTRDMARTLWPWDGQLCAWWHNQVFGCSIVI